MKDESNVFGVRTGKSLHGDEGGQIAALGVLAAAAFACLLLLVVNTGYSTNGKIEMQNAADATAVSGATWVARGLNIISLNNVTQTQILALVLIIPALDRALTAAEWTLQAELLACPALIFPPAIAACEITINIQLWWVRIIHRGVSLVQPLARRGGLLWDTMLALSKMSQLVAKTFPEIAEAESYRIAVQDGAQIGVLIPARFTAEGSVLPSLPVHKGAMRPDLCDPTHYGSPSPTSRGYNPLLGYPVGQGPLEIYAHTIGKYLGFDFLPNSLVWVYFRAFREANYQQMCGGGMGSPPRIDRPVSTLGECRAQGGGTAVWNLVLYETRALDARDPSISIGNDADTRLASPPRFIRLERSCSWMPPGSPSGRGYRLVEENVEVSGTKPDGTPIYKYRYRVWEYSFVVASVSGAAPADEVFANPPSGSDEPFPLLLGARSGDTADEVRRELRYLALTYRSQRSTIAPAYFLSALGQHRLTYAQARVYNPTAFDLFTQDWRVTLEPASMVEDGTLFGALGGGVLDRARVSNAAALDLFKKGTSLFGSPDANLLRFLNNH